MPAATGAAEDPAAVVTAEENGAPPNAGGLGNRLGRLNGCTGPENFCLQHSLQMGQ